ncbi:DeoR/GlpR family DNA-binding transcription regulator [Haloechinothrix halophila]|uniref:DeoR/GlpR family DNA-binding transcription regulator n=1 Tax=Haloechinothrix halophila TaxID=1069073 RepID=UPI0003FCBF8E|nr:DeoR/GlpR family DNA-binding transcription regulator [Haloechinothrix halophila]
MLAAQRQAHILEQVRRNGGVRVTDLTLEFGVSDMTIRRDLDALARRHLVEKVHGGATAAAPGSAEEPGFETKATHAQAEKEAIAAAASRLVYPGAAIGLSAGTTTWRLAHRLRDIPDITVVTNSIRIAEVFHHAPRADQTVVLTGGVRTPSDALVGPIAVSALHSLNLDLVVVGAHGMDERAGFTTPNLLEADTDRALVTAGRRLVVVADHTKWGVVGISTFADLGEADVVTDAGLAEQAQRLLEERAGELIVVPVGDPGHEEAS